MIITNLDGNRIDWKTTGNIIRDGLNREQRSDLHINARQLLHENFPTAQILEEIPIPVFDNKTLYLDFYIPIRSLAVEVHGEQHFKFVSFFHSTQRNFVKQTKNDNDKQNWCELNNINLIILPYNEDIAIWNERINNDQYD